MRKQTLGKAEIKSRKKKKEVKYTEPGGDPVLWLDTGNISGRNLKFLFSTR